MSVESVDFEVYVEIYRDGPVIYIDGNYIDPAEEDIADRIDELIVLVKNGRVLGDVQILIHEHDYDETLFSMSVADFGWGFSLVRVNGTMNGYTSNAIAPVSVAKLAIVHVLELLKLSNGRYIPDPQLISEMVEEVEDIIPELVSVIDCLGYMRNFFRRFEVIEETYPYTPTILKLYDTGTNSVDYIAIDVSVPLSEDDLWEFRDAISDFLKCVKFDAK